MILGKAPEHSSLCPLQRHLRMLQRLKWGVLQPLCTDSSLRQITQRVYGFPLVTNFKMQACRTGAGATHGSYFLPRLNFLLFPDQHRIVMGVGTQVIIVMFNNDEIPVTAQRVTGINDAPICGRDNSLSFATRDIDPLLPPSVAEKLSITLPSVGQRHAEIGELVDVLLTVGSVVLTEGAVTGAVTTVAGLLLGNILLALCSPESSEYVIVGFEATTTVEFCAGFETIPCADASA